MFLRSLRAGGSLASVRLPTSFGGVASALMATLFLMSGSPARADIILSGAAFSGTNATGVGPIGYGTTTAVAGYTLFMASGALSDAPDYINTAKATSDLDFALTTGTNVISGYMCYGGLSYGATSLFFGGSALAGISVFASQTDSLSSIPTFAADGNTLDSVTGTIANGAGSLSYDNGTQTVTLTNYILASTTLIDDLDVPQVGPGSTIGGGPTIGFEMTLVVTNDSTTVPEPMSIALMVPAIGGLLVLASRSAWGDSRRLIAIWPLVPIRPDFFPKLLRETRDRIEQTMGKLKRLSRVTIRHENTAESYSAIVSLACTLILVKSPQGTWAWSA